MGKKNGEGLAEAVQQAMEKWVKGHSSVDSIDQSAVSELVEEVKNLYDKAVDRGDVLVPLNIKCLKTNPIYEKIIDEKETIMSALRRGEAWERKMPAYDGKDDRKEYYFNYLFPKETPANPFPEFTDPEPNATVHVDTLIDRLGSEDGRYFSPLDVAKEPSSFSERALPYYFIGTEVKKEPSYHAYRAKLSFTFEDVKRKRQEIIEKSDLNVDSKFFVETILTEAPKGFIFGKVAPIGAFGEQGKGGGEQYRLYASAVELKKYGFIEDYKEE